MIADHYNGLNRILELLIDPEKNYRTANGIREINSPDSEVKVLVIPANEAWRIAQETKRVIESETKD